MIHSPLKLLVGLGNPDTHLLKTRHNVGFWFIDALLKKLSMDIDYVKKYDAVVSKAKILVKKFPNDYIFYNALGMALMNLGQFDESLKILNKAIKLDDKNIHVLNNLGLAHSSIANYHIENEYYYIAFNIKPDFLNALINSNFDP